MSSTRIENSRTSLDNFRRVWISLLDAHDFAADRSLDRWDFAVRLGELCQFGVEESELRWLVSSGYVRHAKEVTDDADARRRFVPRKHLAFDSRTCFVLTDRGVGEARRVLRCPPKSFDSLAFSLRRGRATAIIWDADTRELWVNGRIAKRYRWPAANQEAVLNAFQEERWPPRIDDPLPPQGDQDPKRRLGDTIKCLNRKQEAWLIHFRGDGTGQGVLWELRRAFDRNSPAETDRVIPCVS